MALQQLQQLRSMPRQHMDEPYPEEQINSLIDLLCWLCSDMGRLRWMAGHEDLDVERVPASNDPALMVRRKLDPGPLFPWRRLEAEVPLQRRRNARAWWRKAAAQGHPQAKQALAQS